MGTSSEYSGFTQVERGNIVVSINYRLGPLGWFHYYDEGRVTKNSMLVACNFVF